MLGVASVLAPMRGTLAGTVMFIFQPAEEGAPDGEEGGAGLMLKEGIFKTLRPDVVFGLHANPDFGVGKIGYTSGPTNATASYFKAILTGKSAHAAMPNLSVDPIVMAAQAVLGIQTIRSRNLSPFDASVITVAQIHGGIRTTLFQPKSGLKERFARSAKRSMATLSAGSGRCWTEWLEQLADRITWTTRDNFP